VERLVNVPHEMDEQTQIALATPFVILPSLQPAPIVFNLLSDATASQTALANRFPVIVQAGIKKVPRFCVNVQVSENCVWPDGRCSHSIGNGIWIR
jgi:hypothetical protein